MIRKIIKIDKDTCTGCGLCAQACHEAAIGMVNGKAELLRDDYCDGMGDCLPSCPAGAITFEEREAALYDEAAVQANMLKKTSHPPAGSCPGSRAQVIHRETPAPGVNPPKQESCLNQWPIQIKLVPVKAGYFTNADLLISADCAAYAYGNFHQDFIKDKIILIGCPKLDETDYSKKLTELLTANEIKSVTVVRMEVPCCGGIEYAVKKAVENSGKALELRVVVISTSGEIVEDRF